jgi:pimeloyl-ACP methyl ester carboxylesterase
MNRQLSLAIAGLCLCSYLSAKQVRMMNVDQGVQLEVLDWGGSGRVIILLAGSGNSAHVFDDFAPKLTSFAHVYGITRRGYGASSQPASGYDNQRLADDIVAVIDQLKLPSPVLCGHSAAGSEITTIGNQHSDRIGGLIYLDALDDPRDFPASDPHYMELFRKLPPGPVVAPETAEERASFALTRARDLRVRGFEMPESEYRNVFEVMPDGSKGKYKTPQFIHDAIGNGDIKRDYSHIRVPVLALLQGPPDHPDPNPAVKAFADATQSFVERWRANFRRGVPSARIVELPNAGHYVFLTREAACIAEIRDFIARLN